MTETIRVLIADDHLIVRQGLQLIFETEAHIELVGAAEDGLEAVRLAEELKPDVLLIDLQMPNLDGMGAIKQLRQSQPELAIVILTTFNEDQLMLDGLQAGAKGFLLKDSGRDDLLNAIQAAARGESLLKPEVMEKLLQAQIGERPASGGILSPRELEVLLAAADGATNKAIAFQLDISERTVKAHLTSVYNKLGVDSRAAAIAQAAKMGLFN